MRMTCDDVQDWVGEEVLKEYKNHHNRGSQGAGDWCHINHIREGDPGSLNFFTQSQSPQSVLGLLCFNPRTWCDLFLDPPKRIEPTFVDFPFLTKEV